MRGLKLDIQESAQVKMYKKAMESLVSDMLYPKSVTMISTQYGIKNEKKVKEMYQKLYNVRVTKVQVFISLKQPWLCASPDGIVITEDCMNKICGFKCPSSCERVPVVDYQAKSCNVHYIEFNDKEIELKKIVYTIHNVKYKCTSLECIAVIYLFIRQLEMGAAALKFTEIKFSLKML